VAVKEAARTLSLCVQVTWAQEKDLGVLELLTASHHLLEQVLEQVSALSCWVALMEAQMKRGGGGGDGGGGGEGQKKKKKKTEKGKAVEVEDLESELSASEDKEGGSEEGSD
jgi:hypothetical protein